LNKPQTIEERIQATAPESGFWCYDSVLAVVRTALATSKFYVLEASFDDSFTICGLFSTYEKADKRMEEIARDIENHYRFYAIHPVTLDGEVEESHSFTHHELRERWTDERLAHEPDESMDGDHESALRDAGFGTDEDYGYFGGDEGN
jgi:hypothetical protein